MKLNNPYWITQTGEKKLITWMQTDHLIHTLNMLIRQSGTFSKEIRDSGICRELKARGMLNSMANQIGHYTQFATTNRRESFEDLCALNAHRGRCAPLTRYSYEELGRLAPYDEQCAAILAQTVVYLLDLDRGKYAP